MTVLSRGSSAPVKRLRAHRIVTPTGADSDFHFAMLATTTYAVFLKKTAWCRSTPWISTGNLGERSGWTCGFFCGYSPPEVRSLPSMRVALSDYRHSLPSAEL